MNTTEDADCLMVIKHRLLQETAGKLQMLKQKSKHDAKQHLHFQEIDRYVEEK